MRVRQFKLRNAQGLEFDMMRQDAFLWEPEGLGWGESVSVTAVGNSYHTTKLAVNRPTPKGKMVFAGYSQYQEFLTFCQAGGLVLCYMPLSTWRYLECVITIDKSEIAYETNRLICPVSFEGVSQWYETAVLYRPQQSVDEYAKIYYDTYSGQYEYAHDYEDATAGGVTINNGALSSYFKITFFGATTNPSWRLYVSGELVHSGSITATIQSGHSLVVNCIPSEYSIIEYDSDGEVYLDRYGDSDWTTERFFEIPAGESMMILSDDSLSAPNAFLEVRRRV